MQDSILFEAQCQVIYGLNTGGYLTEVTASLIVHFASAGMALALTTFSNLARKSCQSLTRHLNYSATGLINLGNFNGFW